MKKLALALVCLVSLAFFASCDPVVENPEPSISIIATEGYVHEGMALTMNEVYPIGFICRANEETQKNLQRLVININEVTWVDTTITGTEFTFDAEIMFEPNERGEIFPAAIVATLTDEDGQTATAEMNVTVEENEVPLTSESKEWVRRGANNQDADEMALYGLKWTGSHKEVFATLEPLNDNIKMYYSDDAEFEGIEFLSEKLAFVNNLLETSRPITEYRNITTNNSADYHDVLTMMLEDGTIYLINIQHATIETGSFGTQITISAEIK